MTWKCWIQTPSGVEKRENVAECMNLPDGRLVIKNDSGEQLSPREGKIVRVKREIDETSNS